MNRPAFGSSLDTFQPSIPVKTLQPLLFQTQPKGPGIHRFAVIGDPGSGNGHQWNVANSLWTAYQESPFASVLVLGDNVYEHGEPHLFDQRIRQPYAPLFEAGVRFFPVLGNHDVNKGYGDLQCRYWGVPPYYNVHIGNVEIFALDTTVLLPSVGNTYTGRETFAAERAAQQRQWLVKALAQSRAPFKIVMGHYPIYSSGDHAVKLKKYDPLRQELQPLFEQYGVNLYLSGHEHHYERSAPIAGVTHIVSGAAGKLIFKDWPSPSHYPRERFIRQFHFMIFEIQHQGDLTFQVRSENGQIIDQGVVPFHHRHKK